jgi:glyoxylase-like metal-dependent hydrolase (beta-lactamase superfamily II)
VDTGVGSTSTNPEVKAYLGTEEGRLLADLQTLGVRPEDVDTVFFTHLHPDHVGWNLRETGTNPRPTFPRARYIIHKADWDFFGNPQFQEQLPFQYWEATLGPLEPLGVIDFITEERTLTSEITAIPTPGHTPGHMSLLITSAGQRAVILGDVAVHPAQVTEDSWHFLFDADPARANQTRQEFLDRLEREGLTVAACHFPVPGYGRIVRIEGRRYWQGL